MLPAAARLRRPAEFRHAVRTGRRIGAAPLVLHLSLGAGPSRRAGFVVGRDVGTAVRRNRLRRRLRHLVAQRLTDLPPGSMLVVRARPEAAEHSSAQLASALTRGLARWTVAAAGPERG